MHLAELITVDGDRCRCEACQWRCSLGVGEVGRCQLRVGVEGGIELLNHSMISGAAIGPVEDHRLWHFFPDSLVLSIGSFGYAFPGDQQRAPHALLPEDPAKRRKLDADRAANFALERLCRGVVWTYSEPAVSFEYSRDLLQLCRASSRYTAIVTSGYMTIEALDKYGPYLDGVSLELRGFSDYSYHRLADIPDWRGILAVAEHARKRWNCHIEVTTRIHHGVNDNPDELRAMAQWISETLGPQTPWHILPGDAGSETAAAAMRARRIAMELGISFVYGAEPNQATRCPSCQSTLITRTNGVAKLVGLNDNRCATCNYEVNVHLSIFKKR